MKQQYKILLSAIGIIVLAAGLSLAFLPWKIPLGKKLQTLLEAKGFHHVRLTVSDVNFNNATLRNITIGDDNPLTLKNITIHYSPSEIWKGNLRELTVSGLALEVRQKEGRWTVQGFNSPSPEAAFHLPVTPEQIAEIPFDNLKLSDSTINIVSDAWKISMPIELEWRKTAGPEISLHAKGAAFNGNKMKARIAKVDVKTKMDNESWQGPWDLEGIQFEASDAAIPVMDGTGTLKADAETLTLTGRMKDKDESYKAAFTLAYPWADSQKATLTLTEGSMPWHGGKLALNRTVVPLVGSSPVRLTLQVEKVSAGELMQTLTGKRIAATGIISGALPLIIGRDGSVSFGDGKLKAEGPGTISMPPDVIPGDNEQVALTRNILKNFHYDGLSLSVSNGTDGALSVLVALEGKNPEVLGGRAAKLNIRLNGDILDLVRQSAIFLAEPPKILNQERP